MMFLYRYITITVMSFVGILLPCVHPKRSDHHQRSGSILSIYIANVNLMHTEIINLLAH